MISRILGKTHSALIAGRRRDAVARALGKMLAELKIPSASLLDVGCGDGVVASILRDRVQGLEHVEGVEVIVPSSTSIPVRPFDGSSIPHNDKSFDVVLLCDVLHHVADYSGIVRLLSECGRVAREAVLVKDHPIDTAFDRKFISLLDTVGNWNAGIAMPLTFLSRGQWRHAFLDADLSPLHYSEAPFGIHPPIVRRFTEIPFWSKPYHFICALAPNRRKS